MRRTRARFYRLQHIRERTVLCYSDFYGVIEKDKVLIVRNGAEALGHSDHEAHLGKLMRR